MTTRPTDKLHTATPGGDDITTFILPSGLRVVVRRTTSPVVYCGYIVCAGTRHEEPADSGMAHFIEHMTFKGTARHSARAIANVLERHGGELNAYTNKQETVYYATVLREHFARAADLLTDIVFHSTFPQHEIDREVEVICDEIESFKDSPSELIFDEFEQLLYGSHALGRDILGDADRLRSYTTADALRFTTMHYRASNAVFYASGGITAAQVERVLQRLWSGVTPQPVLTASAPPMLLRTERTERRHRDTHQAHVLMGTQTYSGTDDRRYALMLLNNLLGGPGMNSRLNQSLRERSGLVYTVDASLTTYTDSGWWAVYFGCDAHDVSRCIRLVNAQLRRLTDGALRPATLLAAKRQLCGQVMISTDGAENYALALGKTFAQYGSIYSPEALCRRIMDLEADDVLDVAREVYDSHALTTLVYR